MKNLALALLFLLSSLSFAGNLSIDKSASNIAVEVHASPSHTFYMAVKDYQSDIQLDPKTLEISKVAFSFKFADLDSDSKGRDKKMRKWMDVKANPEGRFTMKEIIQQADGQQIAKGSFFMHGMAKDVEILFKTSSTGDKISIDGTAEFNHEDWDLEIVSLLFFKVKPDLKLQFHLEGSIN